MRLGDTKDMAVKETVKHTLRIIFKFINVDELVDEIQRGDDETVKMLEWIVRRVSAGVKSRHQRELFYRVCVVGLWYVMKDEAYRDVFRAVLLEVLENADRLDLDNISLDPGDWHINLWWERQRKKRKP